MDALIRLSRLGGHGRRLVRHRDRPSVPAIAGYTVFSYRVFRGKTGELKYA